jgi:hypothetical protein
MTCSRSRLATSSRIAALMWVPEVVPDQHDLGLEVLVGGRNPACTRHGRPLLRVQFTEPSGSANFAYVGKRTTGTEAGDYVLTGPAGRAPFRTG